MKISQKIRDEHGTDLDDTVQTGVAEKSAEVAAHGNRVYLPLTA
ncbi:hypothetical protein [Kitasatospora griseola]